MRMIKLIILFLALMGGECDRSKILPETSDPHRKLESLMESAIFSLLSCYEKKVDTVGGVGITEPTLIDILMKKQPLPVKLLGPEDAKRAAPFKKFQLGGPQRLHLFVAETSPDEEFRHNLLRAKYSQISTHLATFLIIEWPSRNNQKGCSEVTSYLWRLWNQQTLNAFYVCVDKLEERAFVYTYNPYTSQAPAPWMLNKTINGDYNHPWSLFVREYRPGNQEICNNLDFSKTHDLAGYRVGCFAATGLPFSHSTLEYEKTFWSHNFNHAIVALALQALNATPEAFVISNDANVSAVGNIRKTIPYAKVRERADIFLTLTGSEDWMSTRVTIPLMQADSVVATHHRGVKSQLDKLIGVFDRRTRFGICLVIIATVLFFYFSIGQSLGRATMNVIRMISNTGLLTVPNGNAPRLYLAGVFILVVTIIGVYQGLLASLLTKPIPLPEIDTLEDLANSPHKIYVTNSDSFQFFEDPRFNGRVSADLLKCNSVTNEVHINPSEACLLSRINLIEIATEQNFHVSRETIVPGYVAYQIRVHWALEERFNKILRSFQESRVTWPVFERDLERKIKIADYKESVERDRPVVMTLSNLGFAFAFLGIGLSLATIVFAIEVAMKRRQLARRNTRPIRQPRIDKKIKTQIPMTQIACVPGPSNLP